MSRLALLILLIALTACSAASPTTGPLDASTDASLSADADVGAVDTPAVRGVSEWESALCQGLLTRPERRLCERVPTEGDWCSDAGDADGGLTSFRQCLERYVPIQMRLPQPDDSRIGNWVLGCPGIPSVCWAVCSADRRLYLGEVVQRAIGYAWQTGTCWPVD